MCVEDYRPADLAEQAGAVNDTNTLANHKDHVHFSVEE
jgi:hypothetical protein